MILKIFINDLFNSVRNIVAEREIAHNEQFLLKSECFQTSFAVIKTRILRRKGSTWLRMVSVYYYKGQWAGTFTSGILLDHIGGVPNMYHHTPIIYSNPIGIPRL